MSDENQSNEKSKGPSHHAFSVREAKGDKSYFNRVGSAFEHKDGKGFNIILESVPVDGKITLRTPSERLQNMKEGAAPARASQPRERE